MKKIIIAGAGHGGLIAGARLARQGYKVCLYEQKQRDELGHDWEDRFTFDVLLNAVEETQMPQGSWRYRGDCRFVSPSKRTNVDIKYNENTRQRVMWRKPLIGMLLDYADRCGVELNFGVCVNEPIIEQGRVVGIETSKGAFYGDMIVDALGAFSSIRSKLPEEFGIEGLPERGDVFYAYRAYFDKKQAVDVEYPFEVYLYHECERGLSWFLTNESSVDVLIGRIFPLTDEKIKEQLELFGKNHPWMGENILHGGVRGIIPVRRPLDLMVADGYAAVGDSAFMTTPMNGMGIDLSINAGLLLARTISEAADKPLTADALWSYNREFHRLFGGATAKNEGLKNALLSLPAEGVDFLFDNEVIQASDLAGAGQSTKLSALLGKLARGMRKPRYFFAILAGLVKGAGLATTLKKAPSKYDKRKISTWQNKIQKKRVRIG